MTVNTGGQHRGLRTLSALLLVLSAAVNARAAGEYRTVEI